MVNETVPKDILDKLNAGIEISNVDFDIRDLVYTQDSIEVIQDTFADCKVEIHNPAGTILPTGIYGWDGGVWETLNTDTFNRLLVKDANSDTIKDDTGDMVTELTTIGNYYDIISGTLRAGSNVASDSTVTLYTVPANTVFYLTSASLQNRTTAADSGGNATLKAATLAIIDMESVDVANSTEALSINPVIPIKLIATQTIQVVSSTTGNRATGSFVGYEVAV